MKQELDFIARMEKNGYKRVKIESDGNCIFSSVSDQLYGKNYHDQIRKFVCDYMDVERDHFRPFITHSLGLEKYIEQMRKPGSWAGDIELQVISELYDVRIEIFEYNEVPIKVFNEKAGQQHKILRLLYLQKSHYDSLHKLSEPASFVKGVVGTLELATLEDARERSSKSKVAVAKDTASPVDRTDISRKCKLVFG